MKTKEKLTPRQRTVVKGLRHLIIDELKVLRDLPVEETSLYAITCAGNELEDLFNVANGLGYFSEKNYGRLLKACDTIYHQINMDKIINSGK